MSLDRHFKQGPMFGCSDRMCCGVYPPEDTDHCPECMVEWPCEVELLRQRAEKAEAELEAFRDSGLFEMWTQDRARAEQAEQTIREMAADALTREAQYEELERAELARDAMWEKDRAALARVRALADRYEHVPYGIDSSEIRAAIEGDQ